MNILTWVLGTLDALMLLHIFCMKNVNVNSWLASKPIRLDTKAWYKDNIAAFDLTTAHECAEELTKLFKIKIPKIYMVGDKGIFLNSREVTEEITYKNRSIIKIHYGNNMLPSLIFNMYLIYLWTHKRDEYFTVNKEIINAKAAEVTSKAKAFTIAYMSKHYPYYHYFSDEKLTADAYIEHLKKDDNNTQFISEIEKNQWNIETGILVE